VFHIDIGRVGFQFHQTTRMIDSDGNPVNRYSELSPTLAMFRKWIPKWWSIMYHNLNTKLETALPLSIATIAMVMFKWWPWSDLKTLPLIPVIIKCPPAVFLSRNIWNSTIIQFGGDRMTLMSRWIVEWWFGCWVVCLFLGSGGRLEWN